MVASSRVRSFCLSGTLLISLAGCAVGPRPLPPPPSEQTRATLGTIGVVSTRSSPDVGWPPTRRRGSEAAKGAAGGALASILGGLYAGAMSGQPLGLVLGAAAGVALAPVIGLGGAIYGAASAEPAPGVAEAEASLTQALTEVKVQEVLRDRVFLVARDQTPHLVILLEETGTRTEGLPGLPSAEGAPDTFLEVGVVELRLVGSGIDRPLALVVNVETRLLLPEKRGTLYEASLEYRSRTRKYAEWAADNAQPFQEELDRAVHSLAERIVEEVFLLHPISGPQPAPPAAPWEFVSADSLQPTLRWEGFPQLQDRQTNREETLGRIRQVTYDLMIWRAEEEYPQEFLQAYPGELVYRRQGLSEPWHKLEEPLAPTTKYFWTIRARFELDGLPRVTQWGMTKGRPDDLPEARMPVIPSPSHYRFSTPSLEDTGEGVEIPQSEN